MLYFYISNQPIHIFICQECIKFIISDKDIYNVTKYLYFKYIVLLNFLFIKESQKKKSQFPLKYEAAHLFSTLIIIRFFSWAANDNDFWRSCDTEDWSNDAENTALITGINTKIKCIKTEKSFVICNIFSAIFLYLLYFWIYETYLKTWNIFNCMFELFKINHIQNKSFCAHNMCVLCIFIIYI